MVVAGGGLLRVECPWEVSESHAKLGVRCSLLERLVMAADVFWRTFSGNADASAN